MAYSRLKKPARPYLGTLLAFKDVPRDRSRDADGRRQARIVQRAVGDDVGGDSAQGVSPLKVMDPLFRTTFPNKRMIVGGILHYAG